MVNDAVVSNSFSSHIDLSSTLMEENDFFKKYLMNFNDKASFAENHKN